MRTKNRTLKIVKGQTGDRLHPKNVPRGTEFLQGELINIG